MFLTFLFDLLFKVSYSLPEYLKLLPTEAVTALVDLHSDVSIFIFLAKGEGFALERIRFINLCWSLGFSCLCSGVFPKQVIPTVLYLLVLQIDIF